MDSAPVDPSTEAVGRAVVDPEVARLQDTLAWLSSIVAVEDPVDDATRIDRIALLEKLKAVCGAVQVAEIVRFATSQVSSQRNDANCDWRQVGQGIGDQIGLATKTGAWHGARRMSAARALWLELPSTYALLVRGEISEAVAQRVVTETSHLAPEIRGQVDAGVAAAGLVDTTPRQAELSARKLAIAADPAAAVARARYARSERRVTLRPAPDTMTWLTALLPVEQGVAVLKALGQAGDSGRAEGDPRTRGQIMADTLVERATGQGTAEGINVEVQLTLPARSLTHHDDQIPATVDGQPLPRSVYEEILRQSVGRRWRRLFTAPKRGVIGADPKSRRFPKWLEAAIAARDGRCREPFCDAPIRHRDHVVQVRHGGATSLAGCRGVCEHHNYTHELSGWHVVTDGADIITVTPTRHRYRSRVPDPP